jgi:hypothetical protein
MRYLILYGEVVDRRAPGKESRHAGAVGDESARLFTLATTWGRDPQNEELRTEVLRSALRLAKIKGE